MENEVAVVTGGSLGLGRAVCTEIIRRGGRVAGFARGRPALDAARAALGPNFLPVTADITDAAAVADGYAQVDDAFGPATILVNVAAVFRPFAIDEATDRDFRDHLDINLLGPLNTMREAVRRMKRVGRGDIVNVSSESAPRPFPFLALYGATKAGLETLTAGLVAELRGDDIRMSVFRTGYMLTEGSTAAGGYQAGTELMERQRELVTAGGYFHDVGQGMEPALPARALVDGLCTPRGARMSFVTFNSR